jgi:hypothetical protein
MAMVVLTIAVVHAARMERRTTQVAAGHALMRQRKPAT